MKRKISYLLILVHFILFKMNAQGNAAGKVNNTILVPHQEQVFLHSNTTMAFVGEYIYYTLYCLKDNTGKLSDVSKIAYVKLVNQDKEVVLNHKIKLDNGIGDSNFFVPSSIPSGNYKLVAYTNWMLNNGKNYFYSEDITILNPYTSDQSVFRYTQVTDTLQKTATVKTEAVYGSPSLHVELDRESYGVREPIIMKIASNNSTDGFGNYSISIKKVDELEEEGNKSAVGYLKEYPEKKALGSLILPELRGELLSGRLNITENVNSIEDKIVIGASFPGEDYLFKTATPDENGKFYINVGEDYSSENVYLQVLSDKNGDYQITMDQEEDLDFSQLKFENFRLDRKMDSVIRARSIYNQIENAYYSSKPDTILVGKENNRFYGPSTMKYVLDEYTRFSSIKETFVEVVEHVWIQENAKGEQKFHVRPIAPYVDSGELPLVFVDGILLLDHEKLINLNAAQVNSISISRNQHFYGNKTFQGVVDVITFKSDFYNSLYSEDISAHTLFKPDENKRYYHQSYKGDLKETYRRMPDFRNQLLWEPRYQMSEKEQMMEFFSSDIKGTFEISLEGFTKNGTPVSLKKHFLVE